jgi:hypothetical protein
MIFSLIELNSFLEPEPSSPTLRSLAVFYRSIAGIKISIDTIIRICKYASYS